MKTYEITIKPISGFGTPLKGDTIFGHICWQAAHDDSLFGASLAEFLSEYTSKPFLITSSAYLKFFENNKPVYAFKRPDMPLDAVFNIKGKDKKTLIKERKLLKNKKWMLVCKDNSIQSFKAAEIVDDAEVVNRLNVNDLHIKTLVEKFSQPHNTINRLTGTTGEGKFTPFSVEQIVFNSQIELAIFVSIDDSRINIAQVETALARIGEFGFGKDASTGLGRFKLCGTQEIKLADIGSRNPNACYTLAPCVPEKDKYTAMFFTPFVRFGKHGDTLAKSSNPFKNPVVMADEGAIFVVKDSTVFRKPYIGSAVANISKAEHKTVCQGYSLYIPVKVEV
jgi:CRISPR-associated protein Csm4